MLYKLALDVHTVGNYKLVIRKCTSEWNRHVGLWCANSKCFWGGVWTAAAGSCFYHTFYHFFHFCWFLSQKQFFIIHMLSIGSPIFFFFFFSTTWRSNDECCLRAAAAVNTHMQNMWSLLLNEAYGWTLLVGRRLHCVCVCNKTVPQEIMQHYSKCSN